MTGMVLFIVLGTTAWLTWDHIRFWWLFESLGKNRQSFPEYRHRETGIVFVKVPGGTFRMGSPETEEWRHQKEAQRDVALSPFLIAKYEVTQAEWKDVMGDYDRLFEGDAFPARASPKRTN